MVKKLSKKKEKEIIKKYGKIPSKEEIFEKIKQSQERMIVSLARAWEVAPDDPKTRAELMEATEKAVKLREKLYKDLIKEEPPEIRESYEKLKDVLDEEVKDKN